MLDPELKKAWLAALRSGDYAQGHGFLCDASNQHCCLGVLCEVVAAPKIADSRWAGSAVVFVDGANNAMLHLPSQTMCESWGVKRDDFQPYWMMNDRGKSFAEIADAIEKDDQL